jgi:hypothetical protein
VGFNRRGLHRRHSPRPRQVSERVHEHCVCVCVYVCVCVHVTNVSLRKYSDGLNVIFPFSRL